MIALEELLQSISHSVQGAQSTMQQTEIQSFLQYFEKEPRDNAADGASNLSPKLQPFCINQGNPHLNVPLVTLTGHRALSLDSVRIVLNVTAKADSNGVQVEVGAANDNSQQQPNHQIMLEFKQQDASEGVSRMLDAANQFI